MNPIKLKIKILLPLSLVSALVLMAFVFGIFQEERDHLAVEYEHDMTAVEGHYRLTLDEHAHKLGAALAVLSTDARLKAGLLSHDRKALLAYATPLFQRLKAEHNVTHFYFHDNKRINILRVHQPDRYGDAIDRYTALGAEKNKALFYGVELGPLGTLTLRAVIPVWQNDKLLGYLELGEEIDSIIHEMGSIFSNELVITIDKQYLQQTKWELGMRMLGRNIQWNLFSDMVIVSQTFKQLPQELKTILTQSPETLPRDDIDVFADSQRFYGRILNLRDAGERNIGRIIVLRDITDQTSKTYYMVALISGGAFILGSCLFLFFYIILGRVEQHLQDLFKGLQNSQFHLCNAQRMVHIGNWEWDLQHNTLHCSEEAARIFGVEPNNCIHRYEELLNHIHLSDRDNFERFISTVKTNGTAEELVHRIVYPDGTVRIIRHRAEAIYDSANKPVRINATIHDITEMYHAEKRSAQLGRILEHSWNEIYTFDADTLHFTEVSDGACENLGYTMQELVRLTPLDLKREFNHDQFEALIGPLRRGEKQQISFETVHTRKDGSQYPVEIRLQLSRSEDSPTFVAIVQDISERKRYIEELEHKALYDTLTDLPNRSLLQDRLAHALKIANRNSSPLAVFMLDVVRLREINDLLGHQNGDFVLKTVAKRLLKGLRDSDTVARLGGDEFAIVLPDVNIEHINTTAEKIQKVFEEPIIVAETVVELESAIGIALYPDHGDTNTILIQHADIAMRIAKNETSGFCIYNPADDPFSVRRLKLHGELRNAINQKSLAVYYQPKIDIKSGKVSSVEALARWPHPVEGMISPADFIPMVEQSGMIRPFTLWVLDEAVKQSKRWTEAGIDITVAVNLSTRNLLDPSLADSVLNILTSHQVSPGQLTLEITESAIMARPEHALKMLTRLHSMGLNLSIDDFGTGYSSLAYLKKLPVTELKIDYSFVSGIVNNDSDAVIVRSTIDLAHNLGLKVVAEGVESKEILDLLGILRCDTAQGYYFSRPQPPEELLPWFTESLWGTAPYIKRGVS